MKEYNVGFKVCLRVSINFHVLCFGLLIKIKERSNMKDTKRIWHRAEHFIHFRRKKMLLMFALDECFTITRYMKSFYFVFISLAQTKTKKRQKKKLLYKNK